MSRDAMAFLGVKSPGKVCGVRNFLDRKLGGKGLIRFPPPINYSLPCRMHCIPLSILLASILINVNHPELEVVSNSQLDDWSILSHLITPPKKSLLEPMHKLFSISYD
ncbi:hypothetical protein FOXG_19041 [Fusarium oxysporum f. sp. lycopersici 4287]|uniref:Uncharacterized protein n=2 Tax=Fusarium oxysporum TaxID=5507 RepID=A0A0J9UT86_FUSO4|nr:hypothetical protein FOXG_19041 [Fusarium oxysporum f. sp. lycopersici 4287]EXK39434.1 hypothetical protein FOMG_06739 [Fusarium oxysporum f. sp. melonis 26406]KNB02485.1 hypothetical protein FOXG_19041 [Fusarium oxysporum f. sp. lycopersici 4287]